MASYNKFNQYVEDLVKKVHNHNADTFKVCLTNTAPTAANAVFADITEITAGNGYTAGGNSCTISSCAQTSGTLKWVLADTTFTASGGTVGPFRYAVLYNSTPTIPLKPLIAWWDYGSSITLNSGESFTVDFDGINGVFQLT